MNNDIFPNSSGGKKVVVIGVAIKLTRQLTHDAREKPTILDINVLDLLPLLILLGNYQRININNETKQIIVSIA